MSNCNHCKLQVQKGQIQSHLPQCPNASKCTSCNNYYSNNFIQAHMQTCGQRQQQGFPFTPPQYPAPPMGGPPMGMPPMGGPQMGMPQMGGPQMGMPQMTAAMQSVVAPRPAMQMLPNGYQPGSGLLPLMPSTPQIGMPGPGMMMTQMPVNPQGGGQTKPCKYCGQPFSGRALHHLQACPGAQQCTNCNQYCARNAIQQHMGSCQGHGRRHN